MCTRHRKITPPAFPPALAAAKAPEDGAGLSPQEIRDEASPLFKAGRETPAWAMTFTWYQSSNHPDVEAKLHSELDALGGGATPSAEDVANLPFTRQVI